MRIWLHTLGLLLGASLIASCGMRTAITPEADNVKESVSLDAGMPCGFGPPCDPNDFGGRTCEMLGLGAGELSCDPKTCNLVLKGCGPMPNVTPGQTGTETGTGGSGSTPGLFGDLGGTGGAGAGFFFGGTGGTGAPGFFGAAPDGGFPFFGGGQTNDEDGGVPNPGFFGGAFFGGGN